MPRKAVVDKNTGMIINVIEADDSFIEHLPPEVELVDAPYRSGLEIGNVVDLNQTDAVIVDVNSDEKIADVIVDNPPAPQARKVGKVNNAETIKVIRHPKVVTDFTQSDYATYQQQVQIALQKLEELKDKPSRRMIQLMQMQMTQNADNQLTQSEQTQSEQKEN
jgi:hypothetical protein